MGVSRISRLRVQALEIRSRLGFQKFASSGGVPIVQILVHSGLFGSPLFMETAYSTGFGD